MSDLSITLDALERLEATLETMHRLERFRGQFYNWYDARRCEPLEPRYISEAHLGHAVVSQNAGPDLMGVAPVESFHLLLEFWVAFET